MRRTLLMLFVILVPLVAACGSKKTPTADKAYKDAMGLYTRKDYEDAAESFKKVKELFPDHPLAQNAQLYVGESNFETEKYDDAVLAYDEFVKLYPNNINVPYARFREAMAFFSQVSEKDRDQSFTRLAMEKFQKYLRDFPDTPYAVKAYEHLKECRRRMAEQELHIGNFYLKNKKYRAAEKRYFFAMANFADVAIQEDALYGLFRVYRDQGSVAKAQSVADSLLFYFPNSKYRKNVVLSIAR